jgi:hypothetical protein
MKKIGAFVGLLLVAIGLGAWFPHGKAPSATSGQFLLNVSEPGAGVFIDQMKLCSFNVIDSSQSITGAVDNGSGAIRLTVSSTTGWTNNNIIAVSSVGGVPNASGSWPITVHSGTELDLQGSTFAGSYTSGGLIIANYAYANNITEDGYPTQSPPSRLVNSYQCISPIIDSGPGAYAGTNCVAGYYGPSYAGLPGGNCTWVIKWKGTFGTGSGGTGTPGVQLTGSVAGAFSVSCTGCGDPGSCVVDNSNGLKLTGTDCTVTFTAPANKTNGGMHVLFLPSASNVISNITEIHLYRADRATNFANGETFDPDYLVYEHALNPRVLRFLDWSYISFGNRSRFWAETPKTAIGWTGPRWEKTAWVGSFNSPGCTSSDGVSYTVAAPSSWQGLIGGVPHDGDFVQCEIGKTNITPVTTSPFTVTTSDSSGALPAGATTGTVIGVQASGAFPMYCNANGVAATTADTYVPSAGAQFGTTVYSTGGPVPLTVAAAVTTLHCIAVGGTSSVQSGIFPNITVGTAPPIMVVASAQFDIPFAGMMLAGKMTTFTYNSQYNVWMMAAALGQYALTYSVPTVVEVELCNKLKVDCWIQIPTQFDLASAQSLATTVATNLDAGNKAFFEFSNEIFLSFTDQGVYGYKMGVAIGFPSNGQPQYTWYGMKMKQMFDAIKAVWPGGDTRFSGVETSQIAAAAATSAYKMAGQQAQFNSTSSNNTYHYCTSGCGFDYSVVGSRPVDAMTGTAGVGTISIGTYYGGPNFGASYLFRSFSSGACTTAATCSYTTLECQNGVAGCSSVLGAVAGYSGLAAASTITAITNAAPANVTVHGGSVASWANGNRVQILGSFGIAGLVNAWTTVTNLQNVGGGNYTFDLSANTTDNAGNTLTTCVSSGGCPTYTSAGTASRVVPTLNDGLINAATAYAGGDSTQLNWALNDMETGTRPASETTDFNIANFIAPSTGWLTINNAICGTATYPSLQFILYEGGLSWNALSIANGATLGLTPTQVTNINAYLLAFLNSSYFATATNYFNQSFAAMSCAKYPAQYDELGPPNTNWLVTYGSVYNYAVGTGSYGSFSAFSTFVYPYLLNRDLDPASNDNTPAGLEKVA